MVKPKDNEEPTELHFENGPSVVNGLNLMGSIVAHPESRPVVLKIIRHLSKETGVKHTDLLRFLKSGMEYIIEVNKVLADMDVKPLHVEKQKIDWKDYDPKQK
jgi:hypothetical protein